MNGTMLLKVVVPCRESCIVSLEACVQHISPAAPFTILLHLPGFRIEAAGPILHRCQKNKLDTGRWGYVQSGDEIIPYEEGSETYTTARYAIVAEDGREIAVRTNVEVLSAAWMGTWGGSSTSNTFAVIDGRPAERFQGTHAWIPPAEPPPEGTAFAAYEFPVAAIVEFQATGVPPAGWTWSPDARVLSRVVA